MSHIPNHTLPYQKVCQYNLSVISICNYLSHFTWREVCKQIRFMREGYVKG